MSIIITSIIIAIVVIAVIGTLLGYRIKISLKRKQENKFMRKMGYDKIGYS